MVAVVHYEQCKQLMVIATRDIPEELRDKCAFIINNFKMNTTERLIQLVEGAIDPTVEVEVEGDVPDETETVTQSVELQETMKCRKFMKDLAYTIREFCHRLNWLRDMLPSKAAALV